MPSVATEAMPVRLIVATSFGGDPGNGLRLMTPGAMMLALIDNTVAAQSRPGEMLVHCAAAVTTADGLAGPRGEADELAPMLLDRLMAAA
jgi:hypothetical protein